MTKDNKKRASSKIQNIKAHGSTNLCEGLMSGLCEIISRTKGFKNDVASVLLFTDGLANSGITDCDRIVEAMKDPTRYCEVPPPMHRDNETQVNYISISPSTILVRFYQMQWLFIIVQNINH